MKLYKYEVFRDNEWKHNDYKWTTSKMIDKQTSKFPLDVEWRVTEKEFSEIDVVLRPLYISEYAFELAKERLYVAFQIFSSDMDIEGIHDYTATRFGRMEDKIEKMYNEKSQLDR
jgi:hypothetical protein